MTKSACVVPYGRLQFVVRSLVSVHLLITIVSGTHALDKARKKSVELQEARCTRAIHTHSLNIVIVVEPRGRNYVYFLPRNTTVDFR